MLSGRQLHCSRCCRTAGIICGFTNLVSRKDGEFSSWGRHVFQQTLQRELWRAEACSPAEQPDRRHSFIIDHMSYNTVHFTDGVPHDQDVLNGHEACRRPDHPKVPALARIVREADGEQWRTSAPRR